MNRCRRQWNKEWLSGGLFAVLMALVLVRHLFQIDLPPAVFLAVACAMVCVSDITGIIAACVACLPLTDTLPHDYVMLLASVVICVRYRDAIRVNTAVIPLLLMVLWELLHSLTGVFSPSQLVVSFVPFLLLEVLMWMDVHAVDYGTVVRTAAASTCVMCASLVGMVLIASGFHLGSAFANMQRLGMWAESGSVSLIINPNALGILCVLSVSCLLQLMQAGKRGPWDVPMMALMLLCGTMTLSRTFLVLLLLMAVLFVLAQRRGLKQKLRILAAMFGAGIAAVAVLQLMFPAVMEQFIDRFQGSDITSGRTSLFRSYHEYLLSGPEVLLWGVGLSQFSDRIEVITGLSNVPHNGIQEIIAAWGLPGLGLLTVFVLFMRDRAQRTAGRVRLINWIPFILLLVKAQAGQLLTSGYTMLAFALAYLSLAQDLSGEE